MEAVVSRRPMITITYRWYADNLPLRLNAFWCFSPVHQLPTAVWSQLVPSCLGCFRPPSTPHLTLEYFQVRLPPSSRRIAAVLSSPLPVRCERGESRMLSTAPALASLRECFCVQVIGNPESLLERKEGTWPPNTRPSHRGHPWHFHGAIGLSPLLRRVHCSATASTNGFSLERVRLLCIILILSIIAGPLWTRQLSEGYFPNWFFLQI